MDYLSDACGKGLLADVDGAGEVDSAIGLYGLPHSGHAGEVQNRPDPADWLGERFRAAGVSLIHSHAAILQPDAILPWQHQHAHFLAPIMQGSDQMAA